MNNRLSSKSTLAILAFSACLLSGRAAPGQGGDAVYLLQSGGERSSSRVTGSIKQMTPDKVIVSSRNTDREIPARQIDYISYAGEPAALKRARDRMQDQRFTDCLTELGKITEPPTSTLVKQQVAFLDAFATARLALRGESGTAMDAGSKIKEFVEEYPQSIHFYPATEMLGELYMAIGQAELAEQEFAKLAGTEWPEFRAKGLYLRGQTQLMLGNMDDAKTVFEDLSGLTGTDNFTQEYRSIAKCQIARIASISGDSKAKDTILEIIRTENPDSRKLLFANAYNALGAIHENQNQFKDAAKAYLHTELLFATESGPHAEALFRLSQIWQKLGETDRSARARSRLQSRYRNSYWATKL